MTTPQPPWPGDQEPASPPGQSPGPPYPPAPAPPAPAGLSYPPTGPAYPSTYPPPGYPPAYPGYPGYPGGTYGIPPTYPGTGPQRLSGLMTALTVLLVIAGLGSVGAAASYFHRFSVLDSEDPDTTQQDLDDADELCMIFAGLTSMVMFAIMVVWIVWQHRHARNAQLLGQREGLGPGWAIGGWFIPIGNFAVPMAQLHNSAVASDPMRARTGRASAPGVLWAWWLFFITAAIFWIAAVIRSEAIPTIDEYQKSEDPPSPGAFKNADQLYAVSWLMYLGAAILAIIVVHSLTTRQRVAMGDRGLPI